MEAYTLVADGTIGRLAASHYGHSTLKRARRPGAERAPNGEELVFNHAPSMTVRLLCRSDWSADQTPNSFSGTP
jgi:hypothetical protein